MKKYIWVPTLGHPTRKRFGVPCWFYPNQSVLPHYIRYPFEAFKDFVNTIRKEQVTSFLCFRKTTSMPKDVIKIICGYMEQGRKYKGPFIDTDNYDNNWPYLKEGLKQDFRKGCAKFVNVLMLLAVIIIMIIINEMSIEGYFEQLFRCFEESGFPGLKDELQNALVSFGNGDITMDQFYAQYEDIVNNRFKPVASSSSKRLKKAQAQAPAPVPSKQEIKMVTTPQEILMRYFYETVLWGIQEVSAYERETCGRPLSRTTAPVIAEKQRDEEERLKRKRDEEKVVVDKDDIALSMAKELKPKSSSVVTKRRKLRKDTLAKQEEQERQGKLIVVTPALLYRGIEWCVMKQRLPPMHRILQKYF